MKRQPCVLLGGQATFALPLSPNQRNNAAAATEEMFGDIYNSVGQAWAINEVEMVFVLDEMYSIAQSRL
jgi:hypothetical protein